MTGCTTITDWKNESRKVPSQSRDLRRPHSMLYRIVKNADAKMLNVTTEIGGTNKQSIYSASEIDLLCINV